ncbi:MAG: O-antigen ligase family protein [Chloroflexi bacterium]|nr:O-antigen ligase family protein [Chloroflexota bacterium]
MTTHRARILTIFWLLIAVLALLGIGAMNARQAYLTRGIPPGLPGPITHAGVTSGLNVYLNQYDDTQLADNLSQITDMGVQVVKQPFYFDEAFDWAEADRIVTAVTNHNLLLIPLLDGNPADNFAPPNPDDFAAWAGEFATRYGDTIQHYIIWDEPNLTTHWGNQPINPIEYAALLTAAAHTIRTADSQAIIAAAPLAPTIETGPQNLADLLYLQQLYEEGAADAFDIVMAKPYGFDSGPDDRDVNLDTTNFSRAILLREVMERNDDTDKAIWLGNFGWNALPEDWTGNPSIWGNVTELEQADFTLEAIKRVRQEWPWLGVMFLENWQPDAPANDPRWGFSIAGRETAVELSHFLTEQDPRVAWSGFHLASPDDPAQEYEGGWRFSPEFGADISQHPDDQLTGDRATFTFWGTDAGLRVRRANFRARLYVTVDGEPANALPQDEHGAALILTAADPAEDYITLEPVAANLEPRRHVMEIAASRGWDQWALNGFSVAYHSPNTAVTLTIWALAGTAVLGFILAVYSSRKADWGGWLRNAPTRYRRLDDGWQLALTWGTAVLVTIGGWLTWSEQAGSVYRRLGDGSQLALTAAAASVFYVSPSFVLTAATLLILFILIYFRPAWGLALVAVCFPFSVQPVLKPIFQYRFSPVEIFMLVTFAAFVVRMASNKWQVASGKSASLQVASERSTDYRLRITDYAVLVFFLIATASLFFTERLDVAANEWRLVILEPVLFYVIMRGVRPSDKEMWTILDAFVLGGFIVALVGLWQFGFDRDSLITAEGGLLRLKSFYGSPNNVGLYLGRVIPILAAMALLGTAENGQRRWLYTAVLLPIGLAALLTFSKGAIFLGLPAAFLFVFWQWQRIHGRRTWPWVIAFGGLGLVGLFIIQQIPALAGRLGLFGETGLFRLNLWQASLNMAADHPWFGVGLDNFLYAYRGRYILDAAWRDPNLNHPHNIILDFATRLGLLGLLAGVWLLAMLPVNLWQSRPTISRLWLPIWVGIGATFVDMLVHGLVDHSFFLVDLSFAFFLLLGTAVWLREKVMWE